MRSPSARALLLCFSLLTLAGAKLPAAQQPSAADTSRFREWGFLESGGAKMEYLDGFVTGFFTGPRSRGFLGLYDCLQKNVSITQEISMIDAYYASHPQRWSAPFAYAWGEALTVADGPCPGIDPWRAGDTKARKHKSEVR